MSHTNCTRTLGNHVAAWCRAADRDASLGAMRAAPFHLPNGAGGRRERHRYGYRNDYRQRNQLGEIADDRSCVPRFAWSRSDVLLQEADRTQGQP